MHDFLTFKNPLFESVANDFLNGVKQSYTYSHKVLVALNGTGAHKADICICEIRFMSTKTYIYIYVFSFVTSSCLNYKSHLADNAEIMAFLKNTALSV